MKRHAIERRCAAALLTLAWAGCGGSSSTGGLPWSVVTTDTLAAADHGYETSGGARVLITLPPTAGLAAGQEVAVRAQGAGGFRVRAGVGQSITVGGEVSFPATTWVERDATHGFFGLAASSDGSRLLSGESASVGEGAPSFGQLFTSSDAGKTWARCDRSPDTGWSAFASSADGERLAAVSDGVVHTSSDGGLTWTARTGAPAGILALAASADGRALVAAESYGRVHLSRDGGATWAVAGDVPVGAWSAVASSADGGTLVAATYFGWIHASTDGGLHWSVTGPQRRWGSLAVSADGARMVAAAGDGWVYTSSDSGSTWRQGASRRPWTSVAMSADGTKLIAVELIWDGVGGYGGAAYTSHDAGDTWRVSDAALSPGWRAIASSADGTRLVGATGGGAIYASVPTARIPGSADLIEGAQGASVRLIYAGGGVFQARDASGTLFGY